MRTTQVPFILTLALLAACGRTPVSDCTDVLETPLELKLTTAGAAEVSRQLRVTGSFVGASDSSPATVQFSIERAPAGSRASLAVVSPTEVTLIPDVGGEYVVRGVGADECRTSAPSLAAFFIRGTTSPNRAPVALIRAPTRAGLRSMTLDGTESRDPDGDALTFAWAIVSQPTGSNPQLTDERLPLATFQPTAEGTYVVQLTVWDGQAVSAPVQALITIAAGANAPPSARLPPDATVTIGTAVAVSGAMSSDPEGAPLTYQWSLLAKPSGSTAVLTGTGANRSFQPDLAGPYTVRLVVNDGVQDSSAVQVSFTAVPPNPTNRAPTALAGADRGVTVGTSVMLDGSGSSDPDGDMLNFSWSFAQRPTGSAAALTGAQTATPTFTPDVAGAYRLSLTVSDGRLSAMDEVVLTATMVVTPGGPITVLSHRVVDAEFSRALDRLITVSASPNQLHLYDPVTHTTQDVALSITPTAVSVSPNGLQAAVGHDGWISLVDLSTRAVTRTLQVTCDVEDVVLAANGWVYGFPRRDQWETIRAVNVMSGVEVLSTGRSIRAGTLARLHPGGTAIYGANNGLSPSDIEHYDLGTGPIVSIYDSPYHGTYPMGGNLWFTEDGDRIFTRGGSVFWASSVSAMDMTYAGSLAGAPSVQWVDHSTALGKLFVVPWAGYSTPTPNPDQKIRRYDAAFLQFEQEITLAAFPTPTGGAVSHGRFVFTRPGMLGPIVVLMADPSANAALNWGVQQL
ncbi:MAG: PKD domain-containing protein [Archangium sp.]|nr:PKD domain-containing protein [Archangium sp.]